MSLHEIPRNGCSKSQKITKKTQTAFSVPEPGVTSSLPRTRAPGRPLPENPLFYEGIDDASAGLMDLVNTELTMIGEKIGELSGVNITLPPIKDFLGWVYEVPAGPPYS